MRAVLALALLLLSGAPTWAAPAIVQTCLGGVAPGTATSVTTSSCTVTAGNLAVVTIGIERQSNAAGHTLTSSKSDSCTRRVNNDPGSSHPVIEQWSCNNLVGGGTTWTFSLGAGAGNRGMTVFVTELSGMVATNEFDQSATNGCASATSCTTGTTGTLSQASEISVSSVRLEANRDISGGGSGAGGALACEVAGGACGGSTEIAGAGYSVETTTTGKSYTWTVDSSSSFMTTIIGTYKAAASAVRHRATISWNQDPDVSADSTVIERAAVTSGVCGPYAMIGAVPFGTLTYSDDDGDAPEGFLCYRARNMRGAESSNYSNVDATPPPKPRLLEVP